MLILRKMLAKRMKDGRSYSHRQLCMQVSSLGKKQETILIHTTVMTYTWQALWKKKQRTGSVNYHTEYGLPYVVLWFPAGQ